MVLINQGSEDYNPCFELSNMKLSDETFRLLLFYMGSVGDNNKIKHNQREIAKVINISREDISEGDDELVNAGIIYKEGRNYYFNDYYLMKVDDDYFDNEEDEEDDYFGEED